MRPAKQGGLGLDAFWNDDFHHSAMVAMTGRNEAYYTDYLGEPQEFISAAKWGFLYQGQCYEWQKQRRGTPALDLPPAAFRHVHPEPRPGRQFGQRPALPSADQPGPLQGDDGVVAAGAEHADAVPGPGICRVQPVLFLRRPQCRVGQARAKGARRFPRAVPQPRGQSTARHCLPAPHDPAGFERCKLDFRERQTHRQAYDLHRDLLRLRREDSAFAAQRPRGVDGAVLGPAAFVLRFFREDGPTGCCWSTSAATCTATRPPSRCWRRRPASAGACAGRATTRATAVAARRRRIRRRTGGFRARRRWCWCRKPRMSERIRRVQPCTRGIGCAHPAACRASIK